MTIMMNARTSSSITGTTRTAWCLHLTGNHWKIALLSVLCSLLYIEPSFPRRAYDLLSAVQQDIMMSREAGSHRYSNAPVSSEVVRVRNTVPGRDATQTSKYKAELHPDTIRDIGTNPILDLPLVCNDREKNVILHAIFSQPKSRHERNLIRRTFGSADVNAHLQAKTLFFMGRAKSESEQNDLNTEHEIHRDLIEFDYDDTYSNNTLKFLSILYWIDINCANVEWIIKIDEDMFVNPYELATILNELSNDGNSQKSSTWLDVVGSAFTSTSQAANPYVLCVPCNTTVCRPTHDFCSNHYIETYEDWPEDMYPPYCRGLIFAFHRLIVADLLRADRDYYGAGLRRNRFEDVHVTGFLTRNLNLKSFDISDWVLRYPREVIPEMLTGDIFAIEQLEKYLPKETTLRLWDYISKHRLAVEPN